MKKTAALFTFLFLMLCVLMSCEQASPEDTDKRPMTTTPESSSSHIHEPVIDKAVEATCTKAGLSEGSHCASCDEIIQPQSVIAPLGHNDVDHVCTICGNEVSSEGLQMTLNAAGTAYEVSRIGTATDSDIYIASTHEGLPVTRIGEYAFQGCIDIDSINIPDSISSIGMYAFDGCTSLSRITINDLGAWCEIEFENNASNPLYRGGILYLKDARIENAVIPSGVTSIGNYAFSGYKSLKSITIPEGVISIGKYAFHECDSLTSLVIPDRVERIGDFAFLNCTALSNVSLGNSLKSIGIRSFALCSALETVNLPDSLISIGTGAFYQCANLKGELVIPNSVESIGDSSFYECSQLKAVKIGNSVTSIGNDAFYNCTSLVSVSFGNRVERIGYKAFQNCVLLEFVRLPDGVKQIDWSAFEGCSAIRGLTLGNGLLSIGEKAFQFCIQISEVVIPDSVTDIGDRAFCGCSALARLTIGNKVERIGKSAFSGCIKIKSAEIPDRVKTIEDYAFSACNALQTLTIGNGVTSIGAGAFESTSIEVLKIGDSVTTIGADAFRACGSLTEIKIPPTVKSIGADAFRFCIASVYITDLAAWCTIEFDGCYANPAWGGKGLYLNKGLITELIIPDSVTSIGQYAFYNCTSIESISLPAGVVSIGQEAFKKCSNLYSIFVDENNPAYLAKENCLIEQASKTLILGCKGSSIPSDGSVTSIGQGAFYNCPGLIGVVIPDGVISIGEEAFYSCPDLETVRIGNHVTSIGKYAFYNCKALDKLYMSESITSIAEGAFGQSSGISVYITDIAAWCEIDFADSDSNPVYLTSFYYKNSVVSDLVIPEGVTSIGQYAFSTFRGLTSVTIPASVKKIGQYAFSGCDCLTAVYIADMAAWCNIEFENLISNPLATLNSGNLYHNGILVKDLVIPDGVTSIGEYAFSGAYFDRVTIPVSVKQIGKEGWPRASVVVFNGTKAQLQAIIIDKSSLASYTVQCIDGTITI